MSNEVLIRTEGVSKKFCLNLKKSLIYGGGDIVKSLFGIEKKQDLRTDEFWAVSDVNFEVKRGECLGLIGRNGAGKSTLLKMLNGLIRPDKGRIEMRGKVGALIELGAGFSPLLTGRENIYNNGAILGLTKDEINKKFDEIVEFSELNNFIDTPVQNYSSGMKVRLGFAIAAQMEPDILILDEILAVGDASFRAKCYNQIGKIKEKTAMIFVSHSMQQVAQICNKILTMDKGKQIWLGDVWGGVEAYNSININNYADSSESICTFNSPLLNAKLSLENKVLKYLDSLHLKFNYISDNNLNKCIIRLLLYNEEGLCIADWDSNLNQQEINLGIGNNELNIILGPLYLKAGIYKISFSVQNETGLYLLFWSFKELKIEIKGSLGGTSDYRLFSKEIY